MRASPREERYGEEILVAVAMVAGFGSLGGSEQGAQAQTACTVTIQPGTNGIDPVLTQYPAGSTFCLAQGDHRITQGVFQLQDGDKIVGIGDARVNGSRLITSTDSRSTDNGVLHRAMGLPYSESGNAEIACDYESPRKVDQSSCYGRNWLYADDQPFRREMGQGFAQGADGNASLEPGEFWRDPSNGDIWFFMRDGGGIAGHKVEWGVAGTGFYVQASNVEFRDLAIEKLANGYHSGEAIGTPSTSTGLKVTNVTVRLNHTRGIVILGAHNTLQDVRVVDNGQLGYSNGGDHTYIAGGEIARNNWAGFDLGWEAGGAKFVGTYDLTVTNVDVHDNYGYGIWTDGITHDATCSTTQNCDYDFRFSTFRNNLAGGLYIEIDREGHIHGNRFEGNAWGLEWSGRTADLVVAASRGVSWSGEDKLWIFHNTFRSNNGISIGIEHCRSGGGAEVCVQYVHVEGKDLGGEPMATYGSTRAPCEGGNFVRCEGNTP